LTVMERVVIFNNFVQSMKSIVCRMMPWWLRIIPGVWPRSWMTLASMWALRYTQPHIEPCMNADLMWYCLSTLCNNEKTASSSTPTWKDSWIAFPKHQKHLTPVQYLEWRYP
jgi:hypothetical protein